MVNNLMTGQAAVNRRAKNMLEKETDEALALRFQRQGDREAIEALVARYEAPLLRFCRVHGGPASAEDLCQKVFMAVLEQPFEPERGTFSSWIFGAALNQCRNYHRGRVAQSRREKAAEAPAKERLKTMRPDAEMEKQETQTTAWREFTSLPEKMRAALDLNVIQGFSCDEVGAMLGISKSTANRLVLQAKTLLLQKLAKAGISSAGAFAALELLRVAPAAAPSAFGREIINSLTAAYSKGAAVAASVSVKAAAAGAAGSFSAVKLAVAATLTCGALAGGGIAWNALSPAAPAGTPPPAENAWAFALPPPAGVAGLFFNSGDWVPPAQAGDVWRTQGGAVEWVPTGGLKITGQESLLVAAAPPELPCRLDVEATPLSGDFSFGGFWGKAQNGTPRVTLLPGKINQRNWADFPAGERRHWSVYYFPETILVLCDGRPIVNLDYVRRPEKTRFGLFFKACTLSGLKVEPTTEAALPATVREAAEKARGGVLWDFSEPPPNGLNGLRPLDDPSRMTWVPAVRDGKTGGEWHVQNGQFLIPPLTPEMLPAIVSCTFQSAGTETVQPFWAAPKTAAGRDVMRTDFEEDRPVPPADGKRSTAARWYVGREYLVQERDGHLTAVMETRPEGDDCFGLRLAGLVLTGLEVRAARPEETANFERRATAALLDFPLAWDFNSADRPKGILVNLPPCRTAGRPTAAPAADNYAVCFRGPKATLYFTPVVGRTPLLLEADVSTAEESNYAALHPFWYGPGAETPAPGSFYPEIVKNAPGQWRRVKVWYFDEGLLVEVGGKIVPLPGRRTPISKAAVELCNCVLDNMKIARVKPTDVPAAVRAAYEPLRAASAEK